jgi:hypothetical protein
VHFLQPESISITLARHAPRVLDDRDERAGVDAFAV